MSEQRQQKICHQHLLNKQAELIAENVERERLMRRASEHLKSEKCPTSSHNKNSNSDKNKEDNQYKLKDEPKDKRKEFVFITKSGQVRSSRQPRKLVTHPRTGKTVIQVTPKIPKNNSPKIKDEIETYSICVDDNHTEDFIAKDDVEVNRPSPEMHNDERTNRMRLPKYEKQHDLLSPRIAQINKQIIISPWKKDVNR
jgi:hypothetical protein